MKIGIIGVGVVGGAVKYGLEKIGHRVIPHDLTLETKLEDVLDTELCFVCVPTPSNSDGSCNTSIVESVVSDLDRLGYSGLVSIKSTVEPGTTDSLSAKYDVRLSFTPEFLRERAAEIDFLENHDVCVIGAYNRDDYATIEKAHGRIPKKVVFLQPKEAELAKYFNNVYNATLITFANSFYEVCQEFGVDYGNVKDAVVNRDHINDIYLDANENFRGFSGMCLPKDTRAMASLCARKGLDVEFFKDLLKENAKYKATVLEGMRGED